MSRAKADQIIAHVDLLRAVDRLLAQAQIVREKHEALDRLPSDPAGQFRPAATDKTEGSRNE
jgi:hypothetical protein